MVTVVVAAAVVRGDPPRLLAAQRRYPARLAGKWELPGGKVEHDEDERAALVRELREELGVSAGIGDRAADDVVTVDGDAVLRTYWAEIDGEPQPHDHAALRWLDLDELPTTDWLAPDIPVIEAIAAQLRRRGDAP